MYRIDLIQTGSWGDCINSTLMFGPLRKHFRDLELHVHTSTLYASAFYNNPNVIIHEYSAQSKNHALNLMHELKVKLSPLPVVLCPHPMINHDKWSSINHPELGNSIICAWVRALEDLGVPYELPLVTELFLTGAEVAKVDNFLVGLDVSKAALIEDQHESGQSQFNPHWTAAIVDRLLRDPVAKVFISRRDCVSHVQALVNKYPGRVFFVGSLSIRETAELFNRCKRFFSVSSGLSNACNTSWCRKDVQWFEIVNSPVASSGVVRKKDKFFWYSPDLSQFMQTIEQFL